VAFCPRCKTEWGDDLTDCPNCSAELIPSPEAEDRSAWVALGSIEDRFSADYARAVLNSYEIPAVVISKSGFFGQVGLTFHAFYKSGSWLFEVSVPAEYVEEAAGVLDMALGNKWTRREA
jgi:hypothetical protein